MKGTIISIIVIVALVALGYLAIRSINPANDSTVPAGEVNGVGDVVPQPCYVGGCSQQLCTDQKDAPSTCEYKEEYACYKAAKCERQADDTCGWTETPDFAICMNAVLNPGANLK